MIKVGRAIENVTINGKEWLLDNKNELMIFDTILNAVNFLKCNGYPDYNTEDLKSIFLFEDVEDLAN